MRELADIFVSFVNKLQGSFDLKFNDFPFNFFQKNFVQTIVKKKVYEWSKCYCDCFFYLDKFLVQSHRSPYNATRASVKFSIEFPRQAMDVPIKLQGNVQQCQLSNPYLQVNTKVVRITKGKKLANQTLSWKYYSIAVWLIELQLSL